MGKKSISVEEAKKTGKPIYKQFKDVSEGLKTKTQCIKLKVPVTAGEDPTAYVLCRAMRGYIALYNRKESLE